MTSKNPFEVNWPLVVGFEWFHIITTKNVLIGEHDIFDSFLKEGRKWVIYSISIPNPNI